MESKTQVFTVGATLARPFQPWCHSWGKRLFDLVCATILFIFSLPILLLVAILVKTSSPGPVLFRQERSGQDGRRFQVLKFRTMRHASRDPGPGVTRSGDSRITAAGRIIRKWKLDELPQFWNVIRDDMSLVGPRPDLAEYLAALNPNQRQVMGLKPGITGAATLSFRNEELLLAEVPQHEVPVFYCNRILPIKVQIDLEYAQSATFFTDMAILWRTLAAIMH